MNHEEFLEEVDALLEDEAYDFAVETLTGIRETVSRTNIVTSTQIQAIKHILASKGGRIGHGTGGARWARRYEGYVKTQRGK